MKSPIIRQPVKRPKPVRPGGPTVNPRMAAGLSLGKISRSCSRPFTQKEAGPSTGKPASCGVLNSVKTERLTANHCNARRGRRFPLDSQPHPYDGVSKREG